MKKSTWNPQPGVKAEWNSADSWIGDGVPGPCAVFTDALQTAVSFSKDSDVVVDNIEFTAEAFPYTFTFASSSTPALTISGSGISNCSGVVQSFIVAATSSGYKNPQLKFTNSSCAGGDDLFYCAGPETEQGYGGGVICFCDNASAGSATFKAWTGAAAPPSHNTVGGEISFCDSASADSARFMIYGSLGADGDTFGNVVFHQNASAAKASFTNVGGTVSGGDGGNTQFYGNSTAACGNFYNQGGTHGKANGGDVAFDGNADGGNGYYYNYAAPVANAYGGVTSFNNNPPNVKPQGASAGHGVYANYGARDGEQGGGGHVEFSARYGSPTAANAMIINYGSSVKARSSAGHTIFSINLPTDYFPSAGEANIHNHPALAEEAAAGFTEFSVYGSGKGASVPSAGNSNISNFGADIPRAAGGYTEFSGCSSAGAATLIAYPGSNGGYGGKIAFYDQSSGGAARIRLFGNAELDIGNHTQGVSIAELELNDGIIVTQLGNKTPLLTVSNKLLLNSFQVCFSFWKKEQSEFEFDTRYAILNYAGLSKYSTDRFSGNWIDGVEPSFHIDDDTLYVSFHKD